MSLNLYCNVPHEIFISKEVDHFLWFFFVSLLRGYLSPEYATCGHLTQKLDVYSFGVLLLEIVSGRKVMDYNRPPEEINLCNWVSFLTCNYYLFCL